jgi:hypothetical protein
MVGLKEENNKITNYVFADIQELDSKYSVEEWEISTDPYEPSLSFSDITFFIRLVYDILKAISENKYDINWLEERAYWLYKYEKHDIFSDFRSFFYKEYLGNLFNYIQLKLNKLVV